MADNSPQSLTSRPQHKGLIKYGKKPIYIAIGIIALALIVLIWSVQVSTDKSQEAAQKRSTPVSTSKKQPLISTEGEQTGLATPTKEEVQPEVPIAPQPPITVIQQPKPDPDYLARKRELESLRKQRTAALQSALAAPMRISVPAQSRTTASSAGSSPASPSRSARSDIYARHPVPGMPNATEPNPNDHYDERKEKEQFLSTRAQPDSQWILANNRIAGQPFEVKTGTVIPGIMISGINSDLPGQIIAQVSRNVYDTALGEHLLIPQGSRFYGVYDSRVAMGQTRLLVAWNRLIFPDGSSITLGAMPGTDMAGLAGFHGDVNNHYLRIFGSAAIMSLVSGGMAYGLDSMKNTSQTNDKPTLQDEMGTALSSQLGQTSLSLLQRNMQIKPELALEPGYCFNMIVTKDIVFDRPYQSWR